MTKGMLTLIAGVFLLGLSSCDMLDTETPGALVPPTADQDPSLPQISVDVAGHTRALHLRTFGDPERPVLLVLPGGPGTDFRLLLPLQELSDRYYVVMWDPRGAGLSERVREDELTLDSFNSEIEAVRDAVAKGRKVSLAGHSFGGLFALRYASHFPENVDQVVLLEPGPITRRARRNYGGGELSFSAVEDFFWQNEILTSSDFAAADYKAVALLPDASRSFTCSGDPPPEYPMWRFGALHHHVLTHTDHAPSGDFSWADGSENIESEILVLAGTCGAAGEDFQRTHNLDALDRAEFKLILGAGHLTLFLNYADETLEALRSYLAAYDASASHLAAYDASASHKMRTP